MFVIETFDEFDQSSGRVLGRPLSHKGDGFHEEQICVHSNQCRGIFLFCLSLHLMSSSQNQSRRLSQGVVFPSHANRSEDVGHPSHGPSHTAGTTEQAARGLTMWWSRSTSDGLNRTKKDLWRCRLGCQYQLLPPALQIFRLFLLLGCNQFVFTQSPEEHVFRPVNRGSQFSQPRVPLVDA